MFMVHACTLLDKSSHYKAKCVNCDRVLQIVIIEWVVSHRCYSMPYLGKRRLCVIDCKCWGALILPEFVCVQMHAM